MAHLSGKLTKRRVEQLNAGKYADGNGLYLVVDPSGARRWVLRATLRNLQTTVGKLKRIELGLGGASWIDLPTARAKALELRRIAKEGKDPRLADGRDIPTFEVMARQVHAANLPTWKNAKHEAQFINTLRDYAFPILAAMRVDQIGQPEVLRCIEPIWTKKHETARRVMQRIGKVIDVAKSKGFREGDNPVATIRNANVFLKVGGKTEHHAALPWKELPAFISDLSKRTGTAARALEFAILTAAHISETLGATWEEFDLESRLWTIPAERMKAKRDHDVPLSDAATAILEMQRKVSRGDYVFEGQTAAKPLSNMSMTMLLRRMKREDLTVHGFRSTFRDWCGDNGMERTLAEAALAHTLQNKAEAAYARSTMVERRRTVMDAWAAHAIGSGGSVVVKIVGGNE